MTTPAIPQSIEKLVDDLIIETRSLAGYAPDEDKIDAAKVALISAIAEALESARKIPVVRVERVPFTFDEEEPPR